MTMTLERCVACCYNCGDVEMAESLEAAIKERNERVLAIDALYDDAVESAGRIEAMESELATLKQCLTDLAGKMEREADGNFDGRGNALSRYADEILVCMKIEP